MSEEEFRDEAEEFTRAELNKLRQHLSTSRNNWKTVSRLQDPKRYFLVAIPYPLIITHGYHQTN